MGLFKVNILKTEDLFKLMRYIEIYEPVSTKRELFEKAICSFVDVCRYETEEGKKKAKNNWENIYEKLRETLSSSVFKEMKVQAERLQVEIDADKYMEAVNLVKSLSELEKPPSNLILKIALMQYIKEKGYLSSTVTKEYNIKEEDDVANCILIGKLVNLVNRNDPKVKTALLECVEKIELGNF